jgi:hypothetical protein
MDMRWKEDSWSSTKPGHRLLGPVEAAEVLEAASIMAGVVALVEAEEEAGMDVGKVDVVAAARDIEVTRDLTTSLKRMRPSWRKFKPEKAQPRFCFEG